MDDSSRDPYIAALERQHQNDLEEIAKWRDMYDDQRRMARGYRRHFIEALRMCGKCPLCADKFDD